MSDDKNNTHYDIIWDAFDKDPSVQLKFGLKSELIRLEREKTDEKRLLSYKDGKYLSLEGEWENIDLNDPNAGSILSFTLKNTGSSSIRVMRVMFAIENGVDKFLKNFKWSDISFFTNGYQSWSESRSYRINDKPLHSWIPIASVMSENMSNLPSNNFGNFCSDMYTVITDTANNDSILIGQLPGFNQFIYLRAIFRKSKNNTSYLELVFDIGRKLVGKGEEVELDRMFFIRGNMYEIQKKYFDMIKSRMNITFPPKNIKGWSTWYCYSNKIDPEKIYNNLKLFKDRGLQIDYIQIDDGYQKKVGDWLSLRDKFEGRMKEISSAIYEAGYKPAIWIAPFIADKKSDLLKNYPEFVLKTEKGKFIQAGFNPVWSGIMYYPLDLTNILFQEYLREVIRTYVKEWGFEFLKLDFIYAGCDENGYNQNLKYSRSELIKSGMELIRQEAGDKTVLLGCGMPLVTGIGKVETMRIGVDTAPYWKSFWGFFTGDPGDMMGAKNSLRNTIVRSPMNKKLWMNDPECFMVRNKNTWLSANQIKTDINGKLLSGGMAMFSDDVSALDEKELEKMKKIIDLSNEMYKGESFACDVMEREMPQIFYNSQGFLGLFNFSWRTMTIRYDLKPYTNIFNIKELKDVWNDETVLPNANNEIILEKMPPYSSRLLKVMK